jgi:hypothetical protein
VDKNSKEGGGEGSKLVKIWSTYFRVVQICYCPLKIKKKMAGTKFFDQLDLKHNKKQMDFFSIGFLNHPNVIVE